MDLLETSFLAEQDVSATTSTLLSPGASCSRVGPVEMRIWKIYALRKCCTRRKWTYKRVAKLLKCTWLKMKLLMKSSCPWLCHSSEQFSLFPSPPCPSSLSPSLLLLLFKRFPLKEHETVRFCSEFTGQKGIRSPVLVSDSVFNFPSMTMGPDKIPFSVLQGEEGILHGWILDSFKAFWGSAEGPSREESLGPQIPWNWMFSFPPAPRGKGSLAGVWKLQLLQGNDSSRIFSFHLPKREQRAPRQSPGCSRTSLA